jgi:3-oxoadipate enol-lactonase
MRETDRSDQGTDESSLTILTRDHCALNLRILRDGQAAQTPVLFIHALAMDGTMWTDVARELHVNAPVYALDCRGHGDSDRPDGPYSTKQFADDVVDVLDHLEIPSVHLVGCSMGGTVALAFAGWYPDRLVSLCVIDTTAYYGPSAISAWEERGQRAMNNGLSDLIGFQLHRWFSDDYITKYPDQIPQAIEVFLKNNPVAYLESCRMLGNADERTNLSHYRGPTTIVVGEEDYATPVKMAREIKDCINDAKLVVLPKLRHYTPIEAPKEIANIIHSLIRAE